MYRDPATIQTFRHPQRALGPADDSPEAGFALVELLVSMFLLAIILISFALALVSSLRAFSFARAKTVGSQIATKQVEDIRSLPYDQVGTVGGNPPGSVASPTTTTVTGTAYTATVSISYSNDPIPGGFQTFANYKLVRVTITTPRFSAPVAKVETKVAPPTQPSLTKAVAKVQVIDYALNAPVQSASVQLLTGPDAPRTETTPADGTVIFAALAPNPPSGPSAYYDIAVSMPGYEVLPEDVSPAPATHAQLTAGQFFTTAVRIFKPATINVDLRDSLGGPFAGTATVTVSSPRGAETFVTSTGSLSLSRIAGASIVPGLEYTIGATNGTTHFARAVAKAVPDNYPLVLSSTFTLTMSPYSTAKLQVQVRDAGGGPIPDAQVLAEAGPQNVLVGGKANAGGIWDADVPSGSTEYTVTVPAQGPYGAAQARAVVAGPGTTVVTITVPAR